MTTQTRSVVDVAVGVVIQDQNILLASRPEGKAYAGYWEFPGGKIEDGETLHQALKRELAEELGLEMSQAKDFMVIEHDYPHAYVRLHVCTVHDWTGKPQALEKQKFAWLPLADIETVLKDSHPIFQPVLPATLPILKKLQETLCN